MMRGEEVKNGPFKGWYNWPDEPFEHQTAGPFYFRRDGGEIVSVFVCERKHMNGGGVMHGGCLMTFADFALFAIANDHLPEDGYGVTVAFSSEFLSGPVVGQRIEARGEVLRAGGSLIFVRGLVTADGEPALNFSGTIKRIGNKT